MTCHTPKSLLPCLAALAAAIFSPLHGIAEETSGRWSAEKANAWYDAQPWLVGCNFTPSTAVNQLEMWQADTFDPETIDRELGWAAGLGMNTVRTYLHDLAWQADPVGFKKRLDQFLDIAAKRKIRPMLVIFDDCWNPDPKIGKQPESVPSVHNSGWVQSPGPAVVNDPAQWGRLEAYVKDVVGTFRDDERILIWDVYNEPGNSDQGTRSLPLLVTLEFWDTHNSSSLSCCSLSVDESALGVQHPCPPASLSPTNRDFTIAPTFNVLPPQDVRH